MASAAARANNSSWSCWPLVFLCRVAHEPSQAEDTLETTDDPHNARVCHFQQATKERFSPLTLLLMTNCPDISRDRGKLAVG